MQSVLNFIQQILSTPAILVGLIALIGLLIQKKDAPTILKGTLKTILGFLILGAGADVVVSAIVPFGDLFQLGFGIQGVVPNNEAIVSLALGDFAVQTAGIFALGMVANIVLARFSKWKFIFLTGHHTLYMSALIAIVFSVAGLSGWQLILAGSLLLGLLMAMFPAIAHPTMKEITGNDDLAFGHFATTGYWLSAQIGKIFGKKEGSISTEDVKFPQGLSFLRDNTVSIAIVMFVCYIVVAGVSFFHSPTAANEIFGGTNWVLFAVLKSITFSGGIYIILAGVRMLIAEILPAFKGISEKLVPNAKPALDCPIVFPYAPNAVLIGFLCSFIGGVVGLLVLILLGHAGLAAALILPGAVVHFFCGATAGVFGNARGGLKGCIAGSFVHGLIVTFLVAGLLPVMGSLGFANTTFSDTDFTVVGIVFGNLARIFSHTGLFVTVIVLFILPILYNYTIGRNKASK